MLLKTRVYFVRFVFRPWCFVTTSRTVEGALFSRKVSSYHQQRDVFQDAILSEVTTIVPRKLSFEGYFSSAKRKSTDSEQISIVSESTKTVDVPKKFDITRTFLQYLSTIPQDKRPSKSRWTNGKTHSKRANCPRYIYIPCHRDKKSSSDEEESLDEEKHLKIDCLQDCDERYELLCASISIFAKSTKRLELDENVCREISREVTKKLLSIFEFLQYSGSRNPKLTVSDFARALKNIGYDILWDQDRTKSVADVRIKETAYKASSRVCKTIAVRT